MTDILTSAEAALLLGITPETLAAWRHRGKSPRFTRTGHRTVTYAREDVENFIAEREGTTPTLAQLARRVSVLEKRLARIER
ncbi:helix-turn-helix transcriptional regulator [Mycobacteroides abscessus]|uniref:helix-turn-helix transcriptional regulator n=1 Tax=Mycobacteroides abscessus TaxID=36809 RepID=UPI00025882C4|nr:helix-turn-helix domain-containing protein [Mycobacteroides abscessus]EIC62293.1 DNA binding domain-containing protein [Mycobacteroides abscessus M94]SKZ50157.1 Helix-turn-helix domain [Mycobacteroides abscessus subsp. abscessus]